MNAIIKVDENTYRGVFSWRGEKPWRMGGGEKGKCRRIGDVPMSAPWIFGKMVGLGKGIQGPSDGA